VRAAWTWALEAGRAEAIERALECLQLFYEMRSWFLEGEEMLGRAVERLHGRPEASALLGRLLARQAWFCERLARYDRALALYRAGLEHARTHGELSEVAFSLSGLGLVTYRLGDYAAAQELLDESLTVCQQVDDPWQEAQALNNLGIVAISRGDFAEARQLWGQVLEIYKRIGYRRGIASTLNNLGGVAGPLGEFMEARRLYEESRDIFGEIGDRRGLAFGLNNLGHVLAGLGAYAEAERLCQESLTVFREIGDRWSIANTLSNLGAVACTLSECTQAREYFREALGMAMDLGAVPLVLETLGGMAAVLAREGETAQAVELAAFVLNHVASDPETRGRAEQLLAEGEHTLSPEAFLGAQVRGQGWELEEVVEEVGKMQEVRSDE